MKLVSTLAERIFLTSSSSAELCGPGISGLLLLLILDWRSILPTVAAVARPIVLYRLSAEGTAPPVPDHMFIDTKGKNKQRKFLILETLRANMFTGTTKQKKCIFLNDEAPGFCMSRGGSGRRNTQYR